MVKFTLFDGMTPEEIDLITSNKDCPKVVYKPNELIYSADNYRKAVGILLSGKAIAKNTDDSGVIVRCLNKGDCFGVAAVFIESERLYVSEITAKSECTILFIPEQVLMNLIYKIPQFSVNYIRFLTGRIQYLNTLVNAYSSPNVETKLARFIAAYVSGQDVPFDLNMTSLSRSLGIGRASLYRALDSLQSEGIIKRDSKRIIITDIDKLKQL